jgi:CDP-diacylglycerol--serine O-phosphatidyltransferase
VKKIAIIPTLLTLGNAACGFAAIAIASKTETPAETGSNLAISGWLIFGAMICDALDGYLARISKSASDFGMQLDSLCDAVSFGVAPAFLLIRMGPGWEMPHLHQMLYMIAGLYMVCALLRLARFNVQSNLDPAGGKRFRGLPSPGAAGCLASLAIVPADLAQKWPIFRDPETVRQAIALVSLVGALAVALLMVSRVPYPHLTKQILRGRKPFRHLVQVILVAFVIVLIRDFVLLLLFWVYAFGIPLRYLLARSLRPADSQLTRLEDLTHRQGLR